MEEKALELTQAEQPEEGEGEDLQDSKNNFKWYKICCMEVSEVEAKRSENLFEEIMVENFLTLGKKQTSRFRSPGSSK